MAPGVMEVAEVAVHYAKYGDRADAVGDRHGNPPLGQDEHGCSGAFHVCHCCGLQSVQVPDRIATVVGLDTPRVEVAGVPVVETLSGLPQPMPGLRPPIG